MFNTLSMYRSLFRREAIIRKNWYRRLNLMKFWRAVNLCKSADTTAAKGHKFGRAERATYTCTVACRKRK